MTLTTDREEFEKWFELTCGLPWGFLAKRREPSGRYMEIPHEDAWQVWHASRELLANREAQPTSELAAPSAGVYCPSDSAETIEENPKSWAAWKREAERLQAIVDANQVAAPVGYFVRHRSTWNNPSTWSMWTECSGEDYAEYCKRIATGEADAGRFYEARILYDAPPVPQSTNAADWGINMQTGTSILVYKNCSVIESEQAHYVLSLINVAATPAPAVPDDYQHLKNVRELYHKQEDRLFSLAQRIKGASFDKYSHVPSQAIDVLEREIFGDIDDAHRAAMLAAAPSISASDFVNGYCERAGITINEFYESQVPMPDSTSPSGWSAVSNKPITIKAHIELYATPQPAAPESGN